MTLTPDWVHPLCFGCGVRHAKDDACPDGTRWYAGLVECRVCGHRRAAVMPVRPGCPMPPTDAECSRCGAMACDEVEE